MLICELLFFLILLLCLPLAAWSDLKKGIVSNRLIAAGSAGGFIICAIYYSTFARDFFLPFLVNLFLTILLSFFLYYLGIWGAGDSKLLIMAALCLPGRIFCENGVWSFPGFFQIAIIFAVSFMTEFISSLLRCKARPKNRERKTPPLSLENALDFMKKALFLYCLVGSINAILSLESLSFLRLTYPLILAVDFMVLLIVNDRIKKPTSPVLLVVLVFYLLLMIVFRLGFFWKKLPFTMILILFLLIVQRIAGQDNYQMLSAMEIRQGMILDYSSVALLNLSPIPGLPASTTADMRSRISKDEAEAIHAWGKKHPGHDQLVIIRKIPFALFIAIGTLVFWTLEVSLAV